MQTKYMLSVMILALIFFSVMYLKSGWPLLGLVTLALFKPE